MVRFAVVATLLLGFTAPVTAQEIAAADAAALQVSAVPQRPALASSYAPERPKALVPLYVAFGSLQLLDVHSTARALNHGAVEQNPLMKSFAGNAASLMALKAGGAAVAIYAAEKIWKRNPAAAIGFMIAANAGMAWVVQHNYRVVR
jgi:hypothetical protein